MEQKNTYEEQAEWTDKDNCVLEYEEKSALRNQENNVVGEKKQHIKVAAKRIDMEANLVDRKKEMAKKEETRADLVKKLDSMGKKPVKTNEIVRLEKNLQAIHKIDEYNKSEQKIVNLNQEMKELNGFIEMREQTLSKAPKE